MPSDVGILLRVLRDHPGGLTRPELYQALRALLPRIQPQQVKDALARAGDLVADQQGRLFAREVTAGADEAPGIGPHPLRVIAVDSESVVRLTAVAPYTEAHLYQLGAVRFGKDQKWVHAQQEFNAFVRLDPAAEVLFQSDRVKQTYLERARPRGDVLAEFREFVRGADVVVAYNGLAHDFPLLDDECRREDVPPIAGPTQVDGLYLALALWPVPPRHHRLRVLFEHLQLGVDQFTWHDAVDDAKMLAILLEHGARVFAARDADLRDLIASAAGDSPSWDLLFALGDGAPARRQFSEREAGTVLAAALAPKPPQRPASPPPGVPTPARSLQIRDGLWQDGVSGTVDVHKLAAAAKGGIAEPRPAQDAMARQMRQWVAAGRSALVEAPTGTGKTYPMIATALEWLAADPDHRVIVSTFTKQLQLQLARDLEELGAHAIPGLIDLSDMVKGTSNRLSLRAVALALAQMTDARPRPRGGRPDYSRDHRFRDLVIYLALRLIAPGTPTEEWEARSVDPVDVPAFFDDYCGKRRTLYLLSLSQARSGELEASSGGLAQYASTVAESLRNHRLIVANHALLLANLGDLTPLGPQTLLFVDEAHTLESAVTDAIAAAFASTDLEDLLSDVAAWRSDQPDAQLALDGVLDDLGKFLGTEVLPGAAIRAFDAADRRGPGPDYPRRIVVGSPFVSESHARQMAGLGRALRDAGRFTERLVRTLRMVTPRTDAYENERLNMLRARAGAVDDALTQITADLNTLSAPNAVGSSAGIPPASQAVAAQPATEGDTSAEAVSDEEGELDVAGVPAADTTPVPAAPPPQLLPLRNRVVWAEELPGTSVAAARRSYRFRITSSPIELAQEGAYQRFTRTFARTYYVSATLRVAGEWTYMLERLGFRGRVETIALPSPFDAAAQARLVCFSDFPSWAEEPERAIKTVAHQVTGFLREAADGRRNGAMVLTTAKATAAGIAEHMVQMRARVDGRYQVFSTELLGNQRAVETFKEQGGALVGTKGLWQGVDIADPDRLRLVVVNKLPFASFVDPIVATRRALIRERAEDAGADDPDAVANETYYLPLAAIELRQAVGRLIRTQQHRGAVIVTDRKLAGSARLNRLYRDVFLGSLDPGLAVPDRETGERWGGNIVPAREGWRRIWEFFGGVGVVAPTRAGELTAPLALEQQSELPETLAIRHEALSDEAERELRARGEEVFRDDFLARCARIGGYLKLLPAPVVLKDKQQEALAAIAAGKDLLAVLPTGYGKSFCFQLPALALPGVTIVVSPLVALMTDQALELNRSIGGAVRALVAPMRESNSRTGKSEIERQLTDPRANLGIRLVYLSPERLCQRQFQDWIRRGTELGIVRRIAIDEAHTFVQWGDDFRPSFRRAEIFLRDLKRAHPRLQVLAFTATANEPVRDGLRRALFGLPPGTSETAAFAFVRANPIRTDLAIYRRAFARGAGGPVRVSGLLERVVDTLQEHAIFYCLTVREVEATYAHLRDYLGDQRDRVRRYHGRMSSVERAAVANDFRAAPRQGEEGFRPMIVVATSAFGLGIDRPDIRCVFVVSPPTDVAALYQQLGRAGRDGAGGTGLALTTARSMHTVFRMTRRPIDAQLVLRAAKTILASAPLVDLRRVAQDLIGEDVAAQRLGPEEATRPETEDRYFIGVVRVLAELASADQIDDRGDFPMEVAVKRGVVLPDTRDMVEWVEAILAANGGARKVELPQLYERLQDRFADELGDHGGFWSELLRLHTSGYLDVSQAPNVGRGYFTAMRVRDGSLRPELVRGLQRRQQVLDAEFVRLGDFFRDTGRCVNDLIGEYFGVDEVPDGTCAPPACRCSSCWNDPQRVKTADVEPALYEAFTTPNPSPQAAMTARRQRDLDRYVERLLWLNYYGLGEPFILKVLRGEQMYRAGGQLRRLPAYLMNSNVWNARPGIRSPELQESLQRLVAAGVIAQDGARWRLARYVAAPAAVARS